MLNEGDGRDFVGWGELWGPKGLTAVSPLKSSKQGIAHHDRTGYIYLGRYLASSLGDFLVLDVLQRGDRVQPKSVISDVIGERHV